MGRSSTVVLAGAVLAFAGGAAAQDVKVDYGHAANGLFEDFPRGSRKK
jgi:hypothetical protein